MAQVSNPDELLETIADVVAEKTGGSTSGRLNGSGISGFLALEFADCVVTVHDDHVAVFPVNWIRSVNTTATTPEAELPLSGDAFETTLKRLVQIAHLNGIHVQGSWSLRTDSDRPDWELEITKVTKPVQSG